jgi:site-specific DNA-methyltransferase (adenine-specific)
MARKPLCGTVADNVTTHGTGAINANGCKVEGGRWPANVMHDGSKEATAPMGEAARFFYCAKASKADRGGDNHHPTVKPTALMRYLCRLVTQPGGIVLDPFCGSGSTGKAARLEGFRFIGIERESDYAAIARARIAAVESLHE